MASKPGHICRKLRSVWNDNIALLFDNPDHLRLHSIRHGARRLDGHKCLADSLHAVME